MVATYFWPKTPKLARKSSLKLIHIIGPVSGIFSSLDFWRRVLVDKVKWSVKKEIRCLIVSCFSGIIKSLICHLSGRIFFLNITSIKKNGSGANCVLVDCEGRVWYNLLQVIGGAHR